MHCKIVKYQYFLNYNCFFERSRYGSLLLKGKNCIYETNNRINLYNIYIIQFIIKITFIV
jgi:hypothetical protein